MVKGAIRRPLQARDDGGWDEPACVHVCVLSCVQLFATLWTVARQAPLSVGFSRQECWSWLPFHPPGDIPKPGIEPMSPALAGSFFTTAPPGKPGMRLVTVKIERIDLRYIFGHRTNKT